MEMSECGCCVARQLRVRRRNRGQHNQNLMISRPHPEETYAEILQFRHTIMNTSDAVSKKPLTLARVTFSKENMCTRAF